MAQSVEHQTVTLSSGLNLRVMSSSTSDLSVLSAKHCVYLKNSLRGGSVAQSVGRLTLGLGWGHDLGVMGSACQAPR